MHPRPVALIIRLRHYAAHGLVHRINQVFVLRQQVEVAARLVLFVRKLLVEEVAEEGADFCLFLF